MPTGFLLRFHINTVTTNSTAFVASVVTGLKDREDYLLSSVKIARSDKASKTRPSTPHL